MRALVLLALSGCSATEVDVVAHIAGIETGTIPPSGLLDVHVPDDGDYSHRFVLTNSSGTERFVYRAGASSGTLRFELTLYGVGAGSALACGAGTATLKDGGAAPLRVELTPGDCPAGAPGDMGVSDGGADLAVADLAGADLAGVDFGGPTPIFFDDFESGALGKWMQFLDPPGMATVDHQHPHAGSWAVHLVTGPTDGGQYPSGEIYKLISSATYPKLYIRAWYFIPQATLNQVSAFEVMRWYVNGYSNGIGVEDDSNGLIGERELVGPYADSALGWSGDNWTCVEIAIDTAGKQADLWMGREADYPTPDATFTWTDNLTLTALNFGVDGNLPLELWLDDVYVAASRVGCSTPTP